MRIVSWDLETTDLKALFGIVLCSSFQEIVPSGYYGNHHDTPPRPYTLRLERTNRNRFNANPDKALVVAIRDELEKYNAVVTWNGKMFDIPFLNARLAFFGERPVRIQFNIDAMYYAGSTSMRIGSRRLANVEKFFHLGDSTNGGKTDIDWDVWKAAGLGDPKAMKEVVNHCEQDTKVLTEAYWKLLPFISTIHR